MECKWEFNMECNRTVTVGSQIVLLTTNEMAMPHCILSNLTATNADLYKTVPFCVAETDAPFSVLFVYRRYLFAGIIGSLLLFET